MDELDCILLGLTYIANLRVQIFVFCCLIAFENIITTSEIAYTQSKNKLPDLPEDFGLGPMVSDWQCCYCTFTSVSKITIDTSYNGMIANKKSMLLQVLNYINCVVPCDIPWLSPGFFISICCLLLAMFARIFCPLPILFITRVQR
jgi:hypothetical protein